MAEEEYDADDILRDSEDDEEDLLDDGEEEEEVRELTFDGSESSNKNYRDLKEDLGEDGFEDVEY